MDSKELTKLTDLELRQRADIALAGIEQMSAQERANHWVEAQFFIDELERRKQEQERTDNTNHSRRDYWLEIVVIVLIGIEILLSVAGLLLAHSEAVGQSKAMSDLESAVSQLNGSTTKTANYLDKLTQSQTGALDTQKQTLTAMHDQLTILREEQKERIAELSKQPNLQMWSHGIRLDTPWSVPVHAETLTATTAKYEFVLENAGSVPARAFMIYFGTNNKDVAISTQIGGQPVTLPSETQPVMDHAISIYDPLLGAGVKTTYILTAEYPAGTKEFRIDVWTNGENIQSKRLADLDVKPPVFPHN